MVRYAFPHDIRDDNSRVIDQKVGMTLEEYYAGQALAGFLANPTSNEVSAEKIVAWAKVLARLMIKD